MNSGSGTLAPFLRCVGGPAPYWGASKGADPERIAEGPADLRAEEFRDRPPTVLTLPSGRSTLVPVHGPRFLRWALLEATMHALRHRAYAERCQRTKRRLGKQRGAKVAQVDVARRLGHAIWHMLTATRSSLPEAPLFVWRPDRPFGLVPASEHPISPDPPAEEAIET